MVEEQVKSKLSSGAAKEPVSTKPDPKQVIQQLVRTKKKRKVTKIILWLLGALVSVLIGSLAGAWLWYTAQLAPASTSSEEVVFAVELGETPKQIANSLESAGLIRSAAAFDFYTYLDGTRSSLKAGTYLLSPALSMPAIVTKLVQGDTATREITLYPGAMIDNYRGLAEEKRRDVTKVLLDFGFSQDEIETALGATYDSPLLVGKLKTDDLEGYVYGETYRFDFGVSASEVIQGAIDQMYQDIQDDDLEAGFQKQGLSLREAIILASIVQSEAPSAEDQKKIAQVFLTRLEIGMNLGSDVTYQYIADKLGVPRDVNLDNPYNTRRYAGLPPGPISSPSLSALQAVANPANTEYLYFLSGDDDVTYFATSEAEHQANIAAHCQQKCSEL